VRRLNSRELSESEKSVLRYIRSELHPELAQHLISTRDFVLDINRIQQLGLSEDQVAMAGVCHDLSRLDEPELIVRDLVSRGINPDDFGFVAPILLHGVLSAEIAKERFGVTDEAVLDAIRWHATGREKMSLLEVLIYVADKVEPRRNYPGVEELRGMVKENVMDAFPKVISSVIKWVVAQSLPLDYNSVAAYNRAIRKWDSEDVR
jgi:predicted HD superfamily hydrolase involved in NAD metabolism